MADIKIHGYFPIEIMEILNRFCNKSERDVSIFTDSNYYAIGVGDFFSPVVDAAEAGKHILYRDVVSDNKGEILDVPNHLRRFDVFDSEKTVLRSFDIVNLDTAYDGAFTKVLEKYKCIYKISAEIIFPLGTTIEDRNFWTAEYFQLIRKHCGRKWPYTAVFNEYEEMYMAGQCSRGIFDSVQFEFTGKISKKDAKKRVSIKFNFVSDAGSDGINILFNPLQPVEDEKNIIIEKEDYLEKLPEVFEKFFDDVNSMV